jgi:hypothetical protein
MNALVRFLVIPILILCLGFGQGSAWANTLASCASQLGFSHSTQENMHSCCQQKAYTHEKAPTLKQQQPPSACPCRMKPLNAHKDIINLAHQAGLAYIAALSPNPTHSLQFSNRDCPVYLYRLLYPDQSKIYLTTSRLLL